MKLSEDLLKTAIMLSEYSDNGGQDSVVMETIVAVLLNHYPDDVCEVINSAINYRLQMEKKKLNTTWIGTETTMMMAESVIEKLMTKPTSKQAKAFAKYMLEQNIFIMGYSFRALYPNGKSSGGAGSWLFEQFLTSLEKDYDTIDKDWAKRHGLLEYFDLCLKIKNDKDYKDENKHKTLDQEEEEYA